MSVELLRNGQVIDGLEELQAGGTVDIGDGAGTLVEIGMLEAGLAYRLVQTAEVLGTAKKVRASVTEWSTLDGKGKICFKSRGEERSDFVLVVKPNGVML